MDTWSILHTPIKCNISISVCSPTPPVKVYVSTVSGTNQGTSKPDMYRALHEDKLITVNLKQLKQKSKTRVVQLICLHQISTNASILKHDMLSIINFLSYIHYVVT